MFPLLGSFRRLDIYIFSHKACRVVASFELNRSQIYSTRTNYMLNKNKTHTRHKEFRQVHEARATFVSTTLRRHTLCAVLCVCESVRGFFLISLRRRRRLLTLYIWIVVVVVVDFGWRNDDDDARR